MKTIKIFFTITLFFSSFLLSAQIKVKVNGSVGIGTSNPSTSDNVTIEGESILLRGKSNHEHSFIFQNSIESETVDLSPIAHQPYDGNLNNWQYTLGSYYPFDYIYSLNGYLQTLDVYTLNNWSDKRLKKNVKTISFNKNNFLKLNPVSFDISDSLLLSEKVKNGEKKVTSTSQYGFIAQEIQELYPQLVTTDKETGFLKIKPLEIIPILVAALQDQQLQINALTDIINKSNSAPQKVGASQDIDVLSYAILDQNTPNPFNTLTTIGYYLPTTISNASIYIYDMHGVQLKSYSITERGKSNLTIQGSELNAGMYLYALIADGKVIDTKRMILTK